MVRIGLCVMTVFLAFVLSGCVGDNGESVEPIYQRDNWDVQKIYIRIRPDNYVSWCTVTNDRFSSSLHSAPGAIVIPVRGGPMNVLCRTHRGLIGSTIVSREQNGRWPDEIEVFLMEDQRVEEVRQSRPGPVMVAPPARR